jgi:hypothetical protein
MKSQENIKTPFPYGTGTGKLKQNGENINGGCDDHGHYNAHSLALGYRGGDVWAPSRI